MCRAPSCLPSGTPAQPPSWGPACQAMGARGPETGAVHLTKGLGLGEHGQVVLSPFRGPFHPPTPRPSLQTGGCGLME